MHAIVDVPEKKADAALVVVARDCTIHPVQDYLKGLTWDGTPRIGSWLSTYLGVESNEYTTNVGMWWLTSGAARILRPGCKADCVLVLEGEQGLKKSSSFEVLGGEWFSDADLGDLRDKESALNLQGRWIVELPEGEVFSRASAERLKTFVSKKRDDLIPKYSNSPRRLERQVIFGLTINDTEYLNDPTGNRRFWPVTVTRVDLVGLERDRDQLWAEAVQRVNDGNRWWPESAAEKALCSTETEQRLVTDPWSSGVYASLVGRATVTVNDVLDHLCVPQERRRRQESLRVTRCLRQLGWIESKRSSAVRSWVPGPSWQEPCVGVDDGEFGVDLDLAT